MIPCVAVCSVRGGPEGAWWRRLLVPGGWTVGTSGESAPGLAAE